MKNSTRVQVELGIGLVTMASLLWIANADAEGVPTSHALSYSGTLEDAAGAPVQGSREIRITLYDAVSGGSQQCTLTQTVALSDGRFQLVLPDACAAAAHANPALWVELAVDGETLGRTKLSAVPYAVEADRASNAAGTLATQTVPAGAVLAFDLAACPAGWSPLPDAVGRNTLQYDIPPTFAGAGHRQASLALLICRKN